MAVLKRPRVGVRDERTEAVLDALERQKPVVVQAPDLLHRAVTGTEKLGCAGRHGPKLRLDAAREKGVERRVLPQRSLGFALVEPRGILLAKDAQVEREAKPFRQVPGASHHNPEDR